MTDKATLKIIKDTQKAVKKMKQDDIEEYNESAFEEFQCDCCGEFKIRAGSMIYESNNLCNDCTLLAEVGFALNKISNIKELIDSMEDKRFESVYKEVFTSKEESN